MFVSWRCQILSRWVFFTRRECIFMYVIRKALSYLFNVSHFQYRSEPQFESEVSRIPQFSITVMITWRFTQVRLHLFFDTKNFSRPSEISSRDHHVPIEMITYKRIPVLRFIHTSVSDLMFLTHSQVIFDLRIRENEQFLPLFYVSRYDAYSSMIRPNFKQCLWSIPPSCDCLASYLLSLSLSLYIWSRFELFVDLINTVVCLHRTSQFLSSKDSSPNLISRRLLKKYNWNAYMLFDSRMICYSNLRDSSHRDATHAVSDPINVDRSSGKNRMIRGLQRACHRRDWCVIVKDEFYVILAWSFFIPTFSYFFGPVW